MGLMVEFSKIEAIILPPSRMQGSFQDAWHTPGGHSINWWNPNII